MLLFLAIWLLISLQLLSDAPSNTPLDAVLSIIGIIIFLLMLGVIYQLIKERRGLAYRAVEFTTLEAKKRRVHRREHFANRPGSRLFADGDLSFVLEPGQTYRAYYVPFRSPATDFRILSLELVDEPFE